MARGERLLTEQEVVVEQRGHVAWVRLNAPARLNAISAGNIERLGQVFGSLRDDPAVRALVITGTGRGFCSGASLGVATERFADRSGEAFAATYPRFTPRMCGFYKPVITAVNGVCAGGGLHFVVDADIVIAGESATFLDPHVNVGQVSAQEPIGLLRKMPAEAVLRMVIMGQSERLDARRALRLGLVGEVVEDDRLLERASEVAAIACAGSPAAVEASIRAIWESFDLPLSVALQRGWEAIVAQRRHPDAVEGPRAFTEKRAPQWETRELHR